MKSRNHTVLDTNASFITFKVSEVQLNKSMSFLFLCVGEMFIYFFTCMKEVGALWHIERSEDNLLKLVLVFHHVAPRIKHRFSGLETSIFTYCIISTVPSLFFKASVSF